MEVCAVIGQVEVLLADSKLFDQEFGINDAIPAAAQKIVEGLCVLEAFRQRAVDVTHEEQMLVGGVLRELGLK